MKSRGLHLIREPKCGTVVTASAGTIAPPDMELFHDKVPAQLVELAEKVYEQNPLFLADRYSVTSRAQPPATPITVDDEGFLFLHESTSWCVVGSRGVQPSRRPRTQRRG